MKNILISFVMATVIVWVTCLCSAMCFRKPVLSEDVLETQAIIRERNINVLVAGKQIQMEFNDYLVGVLLSEMPSDFHMEAKKAQATAARTFVLKLEESMSRHGCCSVCDDPGCCQGFVSEKEFLSSGGTQMQVDLARSAVESTDDFVITYNGLLIEATYFSCSGGRTEDAIAVWGSEVPYLQSVNSPGEEAASYYTDSVQFSAKEFSSKLGLKLEGSPKSWFNDITYTEGGGVESIKIGGKQYSGNELRMTLQLRSTWFEIIPLENSLIITTRGFGHRVGMSQYGANAMAKNGHTWIEILQHYYQGVNIEKASENHSPLFIIQSTELLK